MTGLPSLTALRLLQASARHHSIGAAAETLGLTQSAASRRITQLEAELGVPLLERHRRGVRPTPQGAAYLAQIEPALDILTRATRGLKAGASEAPLRLRVYSTFAMRWLLPRLPEFQRRHPGLGIRLDTTVTPVSFDGGELDLAIQFGDGRWPDTESRLLLADVIEPVCTPDFAVRHGLSPANLEVAGLPLLTSRYRRDDWRDWLKAAGVSAPRPGMVEFPSSLLAFQAAVEGLGMAMGQTALLDEEFRAGRLVAPFERPLQRPLGYYLVLPRHRAEPRRARLFRRWIMSHDGIGHPSTG